MTVVVTPVGTSLFTNGTDQTKQKFDYIKGKSESEWDEYNSYVGDNSRLRTESEQFIRSEKTSASAELQSSVKIQNELNSDITVQLLASDTIASRLAAEILSGNVATKFFGRNVTVDFDATSHDKPDIINGLQVKNRKDFLRKGMNALIGRIEQINSTLSSGQSLAINITGGYGATLPYLTIYAQLKSIPLYYNFEESNELIKIPPAPLSINWDAIGTHFDVLQRIDDAEALNNWQQFKQENYDAVDKLRPFILIDQDDNSAYLSPLGDIFWKQFLQSHFVVELANTITHSTTIQTVIQDLYNRLKVVLFPTPTTCYINTDECYELIRKLGDQDDLNHSGWIKEHKIFIFKSTDDAQIRLMYSFEVNVNAGAITHIKIYDQKGHMGDQEYTQWKAEIKCKYDGIVFNEHTYNTPQS